MFVSEWWSNGGVSEDYLRCFWGDEYIKGERFFGCWHIFRIPAILFILTILLVVRILLRYAPRRRDAASSSVPASPKALATSDEKTNWPQSGASFSLEASDGRDLKSQASSRPSLPKARSTNGPKRVSGVKPTKIALRGGLGENGQPDGHVIQIQPLIFFSSLGGSTEKLATAVSDQLSKIDNHDKLLKPQIHDLSYIEFDDFFITVPKPPPSSPTTKYFYCLLIPTYNVDTILNTFLAHLDETHHDFRIDTGPLSGLVGYSVFGIGDSAGWPTEEEGFCSQAREVDLWMAKLTGRKRAYPLGMGDTTKGVNQALAEWSDGVNCVIEEIRVNGGLGDGVEGSGDAVESDEEEEDERADVLPSSKRKRRKVEKDRVADLEDIQPDITDGNKSSNTGPLAIDFTTYSTSTQSQRPSPPEMVPTTSPTHAALTKQGYTIVGSHSGVKICRWTKSALRGRGSCYKYSFYGIKSHLCMETTPSLSCSNKCVFCWRHGTNPVGTTWRWKVDPPELIFKGIKEGHYRKIKMLKGVPGVRAERFQEAMRIRHCALSLVGEPIFYPHINAFVSLLHNERISSFLVCNAQHPDQLAALTRVTQLYVSIDASNRDSLRRIDRPLHRDFWERFQRCLDILREKRFEQRTVFRLTLVKGFNVEDEVEGYADLVAKGLPCFVEVKGVTYCGTSTSKGAGLTMQNVPFYEEVSEFVEALNKALERRGLAYGIAAEHAHSCCVLIASKRFLREGRWCTTINYERFFELLESGREFRPEDYCKETPEWAMWGRGGFDPADERVYRKGKNKTANVEGGGQVQGLVEF